MDANLSIWGSSAERNIPLAVLAVSSIVSFVCWLIYFKEPLILTVYSVLVVVSVGFMVAGAFVASAIASISFGALGLAIIRLAAVCMACEAVDGLFMLADIPMSGIMNWAVRFGVFVGLMMWFFSLEYSEVVITAIITQGLKFILGFVIIALVMSGALSGSSSADDADYAPKGGAPAAMEAGEGDGEASATTQAGEEQQAQEQTEEDEQQKSKPRTSRRRRDGGE
jgi:hypothetical protein